MSQESDVVGLVCLDWDNTFTERNMDNFCHEAFLLYLSDGMAPILYQYGFSPGAQVPHVSLPIGQGCVYDPLEIQDAARKFMAQDGNMPNEEVLIQYNVLITSVVQKGMKLAICTFGERPDAIYEILKNAPISIDEDILRYHMVYCLWW